MSLIPDVAAKVRTVVGRTPWKPLFLTVALTGIPTLFATEAYDLATLVYVASEDPNFGMGPTYDHVQRRGQMIEAAAYATSDPSARFEATGLHRSHEWRLISRGKVALSGRDSLLSAEIPKRISPNDFERMNWGDGKPNRSYTLAMASYVRVDAGLVVEIIQGECQKALQWASPYALQRMRAAWGRGDARYEPDIDGTWSAHGDAHKVCSEGPGYGKATEYDRFMMLFEVPRDDVTASAR